jgi:DNA-binding NarL/FixJ family response regulator
MRIKVINDGNSFRENLHAILESQPSLRIGVEGKGEPDVVISSHLWMQNSIDALKRTRQGHPGIPLLVVVDQVPENDIRRILAIGAAGILLQETVTKHISWALPAILNGLLIIPSEISEPVIRCLTPEPRTSQEQFALELVHRLSQREQEVLELIGRGLSNRQIAGHLIISPETVKDHVRAIRTKLDVDSRVHVAHVAWLARDIHTRDAA